MVGQGIVGIRCSAVCCPKHKALGLKHGFRRVILLDCNKSSSTSRHQVNEEVRMSQSNLELGFRLVLTLQDV